VRRIPKRGPPSWIKFSTVLPRQCATIADGSHRAVPAAVPETVTGIQVEFSLALAGTMHGEMPVTFLLVVFRRHREHHHAANRSPSASPLNFVTIGRYAAILAGGD
jgi:hypothetical protein